MRPLDEVDVKLLEIDEKTGKMILSMRALTEKPEGYVEPERRPRGPRDDRRDDRRGDRRGPRDDRRGDRRDDRRGPRDDRRGRAVCRYAGRRDEGNARNNPDQPQEAIATADYRSRDDQTVRRQLGALKQRDKQP